MISIGDALREARVGANLSIEEAAWRTRIRPEFLRALESDGFSKLGESVFVRGHLLSYVRYLGLDADEILRAYDCEHSESSSPIEHLDRQVRVARRTKRPRWMLAAVTATAALIAVSGFGLLHGPGQKPERQVALPALPPRLAAPKAASRAGEDRVAVQAVHRTAPISLGVAVDRRCWVEVTSDGRTLFSGVLEAGGTKTFTAQRALAITLGSASAAHLTFNGASVSLDASGVWHGTFAPSGLQS